MGLGLCHRRRHRKRGVIRWKFDPGVDRAWAGDVACCGVNNRGVALWKDKVISIALDGRMFRAQQGHRRDGLGAQGGRSGGCRNHYARAAGRPRRGDCRRCGRRIRRSRWIDGTDLNTGKQLWRTYTIPGAGEPGNETWKDGKERWKHGGGSVRETATYDAESDTFYQHRQRRSGLGSRIPPGDNKWAASVLALSPSDGKIKWGYQYTPNDPYDFDEISEHPIIRIKVNGRDRKLVVHAARNGFFYALDGNNGSFVAASSTSTNSTGRRGSTPRPVGR